MTQREARKRWKRAIRKWQDKLLLNGYHIVLYYEDKAPMGASVLPSSNWEWIAKAESKPQYLRAAIYVSKKFIADASDAEIEEKAAHELIHILHGQVIDFVHTVIEELPKMKQEGYWDWWHRVNEFTATHVQRAMGAKSV